MAKRDDLYFILNPSLGIVKIGIACDVESRRVQLECGCGVPLTVLRVVKEGADYEKSLHLAFGPDRLLGEWFNPTDELLALIDGAEHVSDFVQRKAADIAEWRRHLDRQSTRRKEAQQAAAKAERDELARIAAEEKRLRAAKKAKQQAAQEKAAARRRELDDAERERIEQERAAWAARHPKAAARLIVPAHAEASETRRLATQRLRNAAFVGVDALSTRSRAREN